MVSIEFSLIEKLGFGKILGINRYFSFLDCIGLGSPLCVLYGLKQIVVSIDLPFLNCFRLKPLSDIVILYVFEFTLLILFSFLLVGLLPSR